MKIYKWLRGLMKASALTTVMFIMQACYGVPKLPLRDIEYQIDGQTRGYTDSMGHFEIIEYDDLPTNHQLSFIDSIGRYQTFDTLIQDFYSYDLKIKLESKE